MTRPLRCSGVLFACLLLCVLAQFGCKSEKSPRPPRYPDGMASLVPSRTVGLVVVYGLVLRTDDPPGKVADWYLAQIPPEDRGKVDVKPPTDAAPFATISLNMELAKGLRPVANPIDQSQPAFLIKVQAEPGGSIAEMYWTQPKDQ